MKFKSTIILAISLLVLQSCDSEKKKPTIETSVEKDTIVKIKGKDNSSLETVTINEADLEQMADSLNINIESMESYKMIKEDAVGTICGCLEWVRWSGNTVHYKGIRYCRVNVIFSKNGRVTSTITQQVAPGRNYSYTRQSGGQVGF